MTNLRSQYSRKSNGVQGYRTHDQERLTLQIQYQKQVNLNRIDAACAPVMERLGVPAFQAWVESWPEDISLDEIESACASKLAEVSHG